MTYARPTFRNPDLPLNKIGRARKEYEGAISTLCAGCGHDSISGAIIQACYEMAIEPHRLAKLSGIGCSSKTPTYFLGQSHGFNSVHGRMPSVATGAAMANRDLIYLGVSGDGDTASIGMGQFVHAIRRNLNILYIVMNNGCYGLTKGQDSATADAGSINKSGAENQFQGIDLCGLGLELGATFVARSFSGDKQQLIPLIKAGLTHPGFALIDVVSPCVTFNNNAGSTKSYDYTREHMEATAAIDLVPYREEILHQQDKGTIKYIPLHDESIIAVNKLAADWDPLDKSSAMRKLAQARNEHEILTGLIYVDTQSKDLHTLLNTSDTPLNQLSQTVLMPSAEILGKINKLYQ
ncbi:MAG: 2-oxoacid:ferredoxin oxidoreductase subunit beta [Saprospiraceae bacterium]|nr:2-oxoacid:ferredoxin oxidoreductase subunit beta [Saprospiraceae bacterium]HMW38324.1 2-oxoacid:ferredoxin oxidoreductase subunit beta [Saprospiraceae bacterium]HMX88166.1 2-oxoacid:ferredoxin oxidoreductase subunit beta [Saprospiraceae bacterium]HMZ39905.1 2-oxoacid:ferredoxin oxidoreductase subunit beta [Saprospiraceae bacterium]HNA63988.1 2-oxoacid:ferredoxin oxidoreductase subunit beta [Saprospiraceae bacterium]